MSVLIVDDSLDERLLITTFLKAAGYTDLITAESARDAFEHLRLDDPNGIEVSIDLILLDITMPEVNGIEACRRIKAAPRLRDIPIVMVTAHTEVSELESAFGAGAIDYITKPLNKVELQALVPKLDELGPAVKGPVMKAISGVTERVLTTSGVITILAGIYMALRMRWGTWIPGSTPDGAGPSSSARSWRSPPWAWAARRGPPRSAWAL